MALQQFNVKSPVKNPQQEMDEDAKRKAMRRRIGVKAPEMSQEEKMIDDRKKVTY